MIEKSILNLKKLIPIKEKEGIKTVNGRKLWEFLESKQDYSHWIKARIRKYQFIEGEDYLIYDNFNVNTVGRPFIEYHLSLDMAKEICMVENNDKGKIARRYFISVETKYFHNLLKNEPQKLSSKTILEAVRFYENVGKSDQYISFAYAGRTLGIGRNNLIAILRDKKVLDLKGVAYQQFIDQGYFKNRIVALNNWSCSPFIVPVTHITPKGLKWLVKKLTDWRYLFSNEISLMSFN